MKFIAMVTKLPWKQKSKRAFIKILQLKCFILKIQTNAIKAYL